MRIAQRRRTNWKRGMGEDANTGFLRCQRNRWRVCHVSLVEPGRWKNPDEADTPHTTRGRPLCGQGINGAEFNEPLPMGSNEQLLPIGDMQLTKDRGKVMADRRFRNVQPFCDLFVL